jgi:hypothetical protein
MRRMPYRLYIKDTGKLIGDLTQPQVQSLVDLLEEEDADDQDYYVDRDMLEYMRGEGADAGLIEMLSRHVTEDDGIEIEWREE